MTNPGDYTERAAYQHEPRPTAPATPADSSAARHEWAQQNWSQGAPSAPSASADASTMQRGADPRAAESIRPNSAPAAAPAEVERHSAAGDSLFAEDDLGELRARWAGVQAAFVDDPKECVQRADGLVSDVVEQLTNGFAHARSRLEEQWARGEQASTEDLRMALMQYREFFERLLAV